MNTKPIDVSIIFINYKTKDFTISAINSVIEKTEGINYEIFVVDNNSSDGSIEAIQEKFNGIELPLNHSPQPSFSMGEGANPVYILENPTNAGFGAANNIAIKQAQGKYVLCLNTDTLLINNAIKIMYDFMEKEENKNIGACGGNLYDSDSKPVMSYSSFPNFWNCLSFSWIIKYFASKYTHPKGVCNIKDVDFITGADIFFRKSALDEIGLFDELFFMYCEEVDLCYRLKKAGYKRVIIPDAKITHYEGKSSKNFWNNSKMRVTSKYLYARKNQSKFVLYSMKFSYLIIHLFAYIFTLKKSHIDLFNEHLKG